MNPFDELLIKHRYILKVTTTPLSILPLLETSDAIFVLSTNIIDSIFEEKNDKINHFNNGFADYEIHRVLRFHRRMTTYILHATNLERILIRQYHVIKQILIDNSLPIAESIKQNFMSVTTESPTSELRAWRDKVFGHTSYGSNGHSNNRIDTPEFQFLTLQSISGLIGWSADQDRYLFQRISSTAGEQLPEVDLIQNGPLLISHLNNWSQLITNLINELELHIPTRLINDPYTPKFFARDIPHALDT